MKSFEKYVEVIKEIADYAFGYGIDNAGIDFSKVDEFDQLPKEKKIEFIQTCHAGYKIAQDKLIEEIIYYQNLWAECRTNLKDARREHDKDLEKEIDINIKIVEQRLRTLTHIGDGLAWTILSQQLHVARRLYIRDDGIKILQESNIEHSKEVADEINKDPDSFALISDITSFVQIGDLLVIRRGKVGIIELKSGKVNQQIQNFLSELDEKTDIDSEISDEANFDKKNKKQLKRVLRQKERTKNFISLVKDDEGIDPATGEEMKIHTPVYYTEYYFEDLESVFEKLKEKIWSYDIIENCLHIGAYKEKGLAMVHVAIKGILEQTAENYLIVDWMSITNQISEPIFTKPIEKDIMIGVVTGTIKVIMGLDIDKMLDLFEAIGLKGKWMTEKETMKLKQMKNVYPPFELNKKGLKFIHEDQEIIAGGGIFSKIFYDNIKPSSIAVSLMHNQ